MEVFRYVISWDCMESIRQARPVEVEHCMRLRKLLHLSMLWPCLSGSLLNCQNMALDATESVCASLTIIMPSSSLANTLTLSPASAA